MRKWWDRTELWISSQNGTNTFPFYIIIKRMRENEERR